MPNLVTGRTAATSVAEDSVFYVIESDSLTDWKVTLSLLRTELFTPSTAVTVAAADQIALLDVSASPQIVGYTTAQALANLRSLAVSDITGQAADSPMSAASGDLLLAVDVSSSPLRLVQVTAGSVGALGGGGGDVTKVGTPVDNQVAVWTGDGTLEGDAFLTWDSNTLFVGSGGTTKNIASVSAMYFGSGGIGSGRYIGGSSTTDIVNTSQIIAKPGGTGGGFYVQPTTYTSAVSHNSMLAVSADVNQSGTAGYRVIDANVNELATGSGDHQLLRLRVDTVDKFVVDNGGNVTVAGTVDGRDIAADGSKLDGIEALADVTDATNVNAAGAVMEADYNANTILAATSDNTPAAVTVAEQTLVGRITAGNITALTATQVRTLLNVEDGATADQSAAEILAALLTVDGSGTGLDADLLDGNEASAFATSSQANATHTGDATGATALTLQPAAITGKGAVTVAGGDLLLVTDVSASPQVLGQVTAQSIADLAAPQGTAIRSDSTSPAATDGYVLTADGLGGAAWEAAAAGSGDFKADGSVDMTGQFRTDVGTFDSDVVDGATANAYVFDTQNTYSTAGANLLRLSNNATPVFDFSYQGGIDHVNSGATTAAHSQSLNFNWVAGTTQTSSGQYSTVIGYQNTASGAQSFAQGLQAVASNISAIAMGYQTTASGQYSVALGRGNTASGTRAVAVGYSCTASATSTFAAGQDSSATANYSAAIGYQAVTANSSTLAFAGGRFAANGDAQAVIAVVRAATTNATQTTLALEASANLVIPADTSWAFSALIVGRSDEADGNDSAAYEIKGVLTRDESNNTALVGSITKTVLAESAGATAWDATIEADDTNEALAVKVTGEASTNIRWVAKVDIAQVTYA